MTPLYEPLWRLSPLPEFLLLLGVAVGFALIFRALMLRRGAFTPLSAGILAAFSVLLVLPLLMAGWTMGIIAPPPGRSIPFDQATWTSQPWMRFRMGQSLVGDRTLVGMSRDQVYALVGERDGSAASDDSWVLRRPRDAFALGAPELVVWYDDAGKVDRCYIDDPGF